MHFDLREATVNRLAAFIFDRLPVRTGDETLATYARRVRDGADIL